MKRTFVRFICLTLVLCMCFPLFACKKEGPSTDTDNNGEGNKIFTTNVKNNFIQRYGNYVFYESIKIYQYNTKTGTLSTPCKDIECDENCLFEFGDMLFSGVYDGRLYFMNWQPFTFESFYAYQDIASGEIKVLKKLEKMESTIDLSMAVEGDYVYYERMILKDGGDKTNPEDYERYICRISTDGTKDEPFYKCEENEGLGTAYYGKVIVSDGIKSYTVDIETKEKRLLFDPEAHEAVGTIKSACLNGKIYFLAQSKYTYTSELTGEECYQLFLLSIDINTGEVKRILDEPITNFYLTDDAIYYVPFKYRILYMPEDYENNKDDLKSTTVDTTLYVCDLDGKNSRAVYTNDEVHFSHTIAIFDGVAYGDFRAFDEEKHVYNKSFFGVLDLETGTLTRPKKSE